MVDSEDNTNIYKYLKISIGAVTRNPEMSIFVPDHLKTKLMCRHAVKILHFFYEQLNLFGQAFGCLS